MGLMTVISNTSEQFWPIRSCLYFQFYSVITVTDDFHCLWCTCIHLVSQIKMGCSQWWTKSTVLWITYSTKHVDSLQIVWFTDGFSTESWLFLPYWLPVPPSLTLHPHSIWSIMLFLLIVTSKEGKKSLSFVIFRIECYWNYLDSNDRNSKGFSVEHSLFEIQWDIEKLVFQNRIIRK